MSTMIATQRPSTPLAAALRRAEFAAIFLVGPLVLAFLLPPDALFPALFAITLVSVVLLTVTPGFRWRELASGFRAVEARLVALVSGATALTCAGLVFWLVPEQWLALPRRLPDLWLRVMLLYPILSALPQEVLFRLLFFRRYGWLFPEPRIALPVNAAVFALGHLMYWNWPALVLTFAGGWIFAWAYLRGGFWSAVVLHAAAGAIVFTTGLGTFFYHGAVPD